MPRRPSARRDAQLRSRIAARRTREDLRYILIVGLGIGGLVLSCCGVMVVPGAINNLLVWSEARRSGGGAEGSSAPESDTRMEFVTADPDSFPNVQAVNKHLGTAGQPIGRAELASIDVSGTDQYGDTGRRTLDHYFRTVPQDAAIYGWSRPNRQLFVAFGKDPNFPGHRLLKAVYVDRSSGTARIKTRG